ncbi:AsnC family transcriptional regulator [Candidatus Woesearchaeota archaeon]|jgi:Lrp/AsnC family transcriptional regulator, leucine-responsive regulatory protein|nr:AsnC family transcriptional regulator [Candidatus Woesearchaeota archaeon]MBT6518475.1 AsnC family transcriptional regulator [Candidatus Woesearchaeota archaeon]MBT7366987.1 AsnC family transcriptional regulator [Candidatus Woesearchaeota archaeon]
MEKIQISRIKEDIEELPKLDLKDKKILALLVNDCRLTFSEIAKKVMLSRDAVRYRINRMQEVGIIQKFTIITEHRRFDFRQFRIYMQISEHEKEKELKFFEYLKNNKNILNVIEYSDKWELEVVVYAKDLQEFDEILNDMLTQNPDVIENTEIIDVVKNYTFVQLPRNFIKVKLNEPMEQITAKKTVDKEKIKIDDTDKKLLNLLAKNGRESLYSLAEELKVSADTINYRIKKLIEKGIIQQFTTIINWSLIGYHFYELFLTMKYLTKEDEMKLKEIVKNHPHIVRAMKTMGHFNVLIHVVAQKQKEFHNTIRQMRQEFKELLKKYDTLISYRELKFEVFSSLI